MLLTVDTDERKSNRSGDSDSGPTRLTTVDRTISYERRSLTSRLTPAASEDGSSVKDPTEHVGNPSRGIQRENSRKKSRKKRESKYTAQSINYRGVNIYQAAAQGSLPLCVLLWGMASAKRVNLMVSDMEGNNPIHYAAVADTPEIIGFLIQQTRGRLTEEITLVESRNNQGETPLLKALSRGNNSVAKALIEEGSDPLVTDNQGASVFSVLAKNGHLWCLNFMYQVICNIHGNQVALELMSSLDLDARSPLDWAAEAGDVNIIEFFIRKGLSPCRVDPNNRSPLYWAVKGKKVEAARFLILCGCDPYQIDSVCGESPMDMAVKIGSFKIIRVLKLYKAEIQSYNPNNSSFIHIIDVSKSMPVSKIIGKKKVSHAIYRHNKSRISVALVYGLFVLGFWFLAVLIPPLVWILLLFTILLSFRQIEKDAKNNEGCCSSIKHPRNAKNYTSFTVGIAKRWKDIICAPEKGSGLWLGTVGTMIMLLVSCSVLNVEEDEKIRHHQIVYGTPENSSNFLDLGALTAAYYDPGLFYTVIILLSISGILWVLLVWCNLDPGVVDTRDEDFEEVMAQSLMAAGPPPSSYYCRTTLVKKPIRSKFCTRRKCVIARMDHYCLWLNCTVGYGNHRVFILFLVVHLLFLITALTLLIRALERDIEHDSVCTVITSLLSREFFLPFAMCTFLGLVAMGLGALTFDQFINMAYNTTTNEKLNGSRYSWMVGPDGKKFNKFDRGIIVNILEFWRIPGFYVNYMKVFEEPRPSLPSALTQESISLHSQSPPLSLQQEQLLHQQKVRQDLEAGSNSSLNSEKLSSGYTPNHSTLHRKGLSPIGPGESMATTGLSGPPSIDFEMVKTTRGDSVDSVESFTSDVV